MRPRLSLLPVLLSLALVAGCGGGGAPSADPSPSAPAESESSGPSSGPSDDAVEPPAIPAEDPPPCEKVRAGIDAFDEGEPALTVRFFAQAVPEAEQYAADQPSRTADLLLEAIRYYAALPADEYAAAITGSPEFKRHQVVTLAVCRYGDGDGGSPGQVPTDDAVPA